MPSKQDRRDFFKNNPNARAWAALDHATNASKRVAHGAIRLKKNSFQGKRAVVIGAGVGGLTVAYELLSQQTGMDVIVLEARDRTGGRCLTLRTGDTLTEDQDRQIFDSKPGQSQVVRFEKPLGDSEPYLNAGPGRIPSSHKRLLSYLKKFGVAVEVYVMNSESNLVQMEDSFSGSAIPYRKLKHNTRGRLAESVYKLANEIVNDPELGVPEDQRADRVVQLQKLMIVFGELTPSGEYEVTAGEPGHENGRERAGYKVLPGVSVGEIDDSSFSFDELLESEFWTTGFYQPIDFSWQPTMFQPVGGMDRVQRAFAQQVASLGGAIHLNSPVKSIDWNEDKAEFEVYISKIGTEECEVIEADFVFSNVPMPFLKRLISDRLQSHSGKGFDPSFVEGLEAVYHAQFRTDKKDPELFLACTTKVGWQAERSLWQGGGFHDQFDETVKHSMQQVKPSEVGVVPIYGGISWTDHPIKQIWYPSTAYHDQKGVLTGAYNFGVDATADGLKPVAQRLQDAREGAKLFGDQFGEGLGHGVAIAWQNMPYLKGGWAQWHEVDDSVKHYNRLIQGTTVGGDAEGAKFFLIGCQVSTLPGWQEGAIASGLQALSRLADWGYEIAYLKTLPDTRLMVEGI